MENTQKLFKTLCTIFDDAVLVICVFFLIIGGYTCYDNYMLYYHAQDKSLLKYKPKINADGTVETDARLTDDLVGWITVDGTNIDFPVMQGSNNSAYLNKDPYGNYSLSGSIFLDSRNAGDFSDSYSLLYGHHMENGYMFGALDLYESRSYFDEHRTGELIVTNKERGKQYEMNIFAVYDTITTDDAFDPEKGTVDYDYIEERADIFTEPTSRANNILGLSTCQSAETTGRFIIFAELIPTGKTASIENEQDADAKKEQDDGEIKPKDIYNARVNCRWHYIIGAIALVTAAICWFIKNKLYRFGLLVLYTIVASGIAIVFGLCSLDIIVAIIGFLVATGIAIYFPEEEKEKKNYD